MLKIILILLLLLVLVMLTGCKSNLPPPTPEQGSQTILQREERTSVSDDAITVEETQFHALARAEVILNIGPNKLNVGGSRFRVKRNPTSLGGAFVYDPATEFQGVERYLVWWVPDDDPSILRAYPLNAPSQLVTPELMFPDRSGLLEYPNTSDVVDYIFRDRPIEHLPTQTARPSSGSYTVREYRMYRALLDTPLSVSEEEAIRRISEANQITPDEADRIIANVQNTITRNRWFGHPAQEIRRASDWNGETK